MYHLRRIEDGISADPIGTPLQVLSVHEVHLTPEQGREILLRQRQVQERPLLIRVELSQEVYVAIRTKPPGSGGAEYLKTTDLPSVAHLRDRIIRDFIISYSQFTSSPRIVGRFHRVNVSILTWRHDDKDLAQAFDFTYYVVVSEELQEFLHTAGRVDTHTPAVRSPATDPLAGIFSLIWERPENLSTSLEPLTKDNMG
jgi:hypothetical protein